MILIAYLKLSETKASSLLRFSTLTSTAMFAKLLSHTLFSLLLVASISYLGAESCPCHTKRAATIDNPTNSSMEIVNVTKGIRATNRLVDNTIFTKVPLDVYDVDNSTRTEQEIMASLANLQQYITMITTLQNSGLNTTELELYRLLLHAILKDSCEWLNSYEGISIDCTDDLRHFIPILLSLGLRTELRRYECYLNGFPMAGINLTPDQWVENTIRPVDPANIRCGFCDRVNLHCPSCSAEM